MHVCVGHESRRKTPERKRKHGEWGPMGGGNEEEEDIMIYSQKSTHGGNHQSLCMLNIKN